MLSLNAESHAQTLIDVARQLCVAARTAPKARGRDFLVTAIVSGADKTRLADTMRDIAQRDGVAFFERDAQNIDDSPVVVLIGSRKEVMGLPHCGFCGFNDCQDLSDSGGSALLIAAILASLWGQPLVVLPICAWIIALCILLARRHLN